MDVSKFRWVLIAGGAALAASCSSTEPVPSGGPASANGSGAGGGKASGGAAGHGGDTVGTGGGGGDSAGGDRGEGGEGGEVTPSPCVDECVNQAHDDRGLCEGFPCCWGMAACCDACCPGG